MKLVCSVEVMNRLAQSLGYGSSSKLGRRCKGVLHIRNRPHGRYSLIVSTNKDIQGQEYDVKKIQKVYDRFVHDGFASIEISEPPLNIMLRNGKPDELRQFFAHIEECKGGAGRGSKPLKRSSLPSDDEDDTSSKKKEEGESRRRAGGAVKRPRSPELSRMEADKIKRCLSTNYKSISVNNREKYPTEFSSTLEKIKICDIRLRKIDSRILKLKSLAVLDLSGNRLTAVDGLLKLDSPLQQLVLAKNEIDNLRWDFFYHKSFSMLKYLDLSKNGLKNIPISTMNLRGLEHVDFSGNQLLYLPYNWMDIKNLRALNVSHNNLTFLPAPIASIQLPKLNLSGNPQLQVEQTGSCDYVGYSVVPTLFEMCSETAETLVRQRVISPTNMPSIIQYYMKGCKYCMACRRMTLRYKINKFSVRANSLAIEAIRSPGTSECNLKQIVCYDCDIKGVNAKLLLPG